MYLFAVLSNDQPSRFIRFLPASVPCAVGEFSECAPNSLPYLTNTPNILDLDIAIWLVIGYFLVWGWVHHLPITHPVEWTHWPSVCSQSQVVFMICILSDNNLLYRHELEEMWWQSSVTLAKSSGESTHRVVRPLNTRGGWFPAPFNITLLRCCWKK